MYYYYWLVNFIESRDQHTSTLYIQDNIFCEKWILSFLERTPFVWIAFHACIRRCTVCSYEYRESNFIPWSPISWGLQWPIWWSHDGCAEHLIHPKFEVRPPYSVTMWYTEWYCHIERNDKYSFLPYLSFLTIAFDVRDGESKLRWLERSCCVQRNHPAVSAGSLMVLDYSQQFYPGRNGAAAPVCDWLLSAPTWWIQGAFSTVPDHCSPHTWKVTNCTHMVSIMCAMPLFSNSVIEHISYN